MKQGDKKRELKIVVTIDSTEFAYGYTKGLIDTLIKAVSFADTPGVGSVKYTLEEL